MTDKPPAEIDTGTENETETAAVQEDMSAAEAEAG